MTLSLHNLPFLFLFMHQLWRSSAQLWSQKRSLSCPEKDQVFQSLQKEGGFSRMVTGASSTFFLLRKNHIHISSSPRDQAGVSLMENIAHDCSDGGWLMGNRLKCKMCWVDWCHWQLSHMKLKTLSLCNYITGKTRSEKNPGTWQISFNHIWQFSSLRLSLLDIMFLEGKANKESWANKVHKIKSL